VGSINYHRIKILNHGYVLPSFGLSSAQIASYPAAEVRLRSVKRASSMTLAGTNIRSVVMPHNFFVHLQFALEDSLEI
jgi:hypothetical protein